MKKGTAPGTGCCVPPAKSHVIIYFLEKGSSKEIASDFFEEYSRKKWKNSKRRLIHNWKEHAWCYIWYKAKKRATNW